jgi:hypothetical protein
MDRPAPYSRYLISGLALCVACSSPNSRSDDCCSSPEPTAPIITERGIKDDSQRLLDLALVFQDKLDAAAWSKLIEDCTGGEGPEISLRLRNLSHQLPIVADYPLTLRYRSHYDQHEGHYIVRAPRSFDEALGVVIVLGGQERIEELFPTPVPYWIVAVPSARPVLGYSLLGEGDFLHCLEELAHHYPETTRLPQYLVSTEDHADDALRLANDHRYRFKGLAFTGSLRSTHYPNLDHLPIVCFGSQSRSQGDKLWDGPDFIHRLEERGNTHALVTERSASDSIKLLSGWDEFIGLGAPYSFKDYQYSQAYPWLRVLARQSEAEEASIQATRQEHKLLLDGHNLRAIEITDIEPLLSAGIQVLHFDGREYPLSRVEAPLRLGQVPKSQISQLKADYPSSLASFYRNEMLVVVYEDNEEDWDYKDACYKLAERFARLRFVGLPEVNAELPLVPASYYQPQRFPKHRAIFVGRPHSFQEHIQWRSEAIALAVSDPSLGHRFEDNDEVDGVSQLAFTGTCAPANTSPLQLGYLVAAPDTEAMTLLAQRLRLATTLLSAEDLTVWTRCHDQMVLAGAQRCNGFYGWSSKTATAKLSVPSQAAEAWENYLRELIVNEAQLDAIALPALVPSSQAAPAELSQQSVTNYVKEREFAIVTLQGSQSAEIGSKLIQDLEPALVWGLEDVIADDRSALSIDPVKMRKQTRYCVVDTQRLGRLSAEERERISYTPVGHTLHELVSEQLRTDPYGMSRGLLRRGQETASSEEVQHEQHIH